MSTKHTGALANVGRKHYAMKQDIIKPDVIVQYNKIMGGVDNLSRVIVPYCIQRKGLKWYSKIAELFLEIAVYNSYIVYCKLANTPVTQLKFRENLVKALIMFHVNDVGTYQTGRGKPTDINHNPPRLIGKHYIRYIFTRPGTTRKRRKCVRCQAMLKRVDTSFECSTCCLDLPH